MSRSTASRAAPGEGRGALTSFVTDSLLDAASASSEQLSFAASAAAKPKAIARLTQDLASRAAVLSSTEENVRKMPELLSKLESALDESLACGQIIREIAQTGHRRR